METVGFVFGVTGLTFAIIAWEQIAKMRKEFESLKRNLEESGVIKEQVQPDNN